MDLSGRLPAASGSSLKSKHRHIECQHLRSACAFRGLSGCRKQAVANSLHEPSGQRKRVAHPFLLVRMRRCSSFGNLSHMGG